LNYVYLDTLPIEKYYKLFFKLSPFPYKIFGVGKYTLLLL